MNVRVFQTPDDLAEAAAGFIARRAQASGPGFTLGLAGGSTPRATYERLAASAGVLEDADLWLGDERWVAPDHPDSNARMVRESLGAAGRFHVPPWDLGDPETAAAAYEIALDRVFAGRRPDLILLGLGDDGHTASLFPDTSALREHHRSYVANWVEAKKSWRLTATLPLLHRARTLAFLVSGSAKADMIRRIVGAREPFPAFLAADGASEAIWFLDEAAAAYFPGRAGAAQEGGAVDT
jgi:6-phosphogluconolactonase